MTAESVDDIADSSYGKNQFPLVKNVDGAKNKK